MSVKMKIGYAVATAPQCYQNYMQANKDRIGIPIQKSKVNAALKEDQYRAVLRRQNGLDGDWYLEFATKGEMMVFQLRWS